MPCPSHDSLDGLACWRHNRRWSSGIPPAWGKFQAQLLQRVTVLHSPGEDTMWIPADPFYPDQLPDNIRRQIFWITKRHTSYTAWARAFAAYDRLLRKMESLLPELASKPYGTYGQGLPPHTRVFNIWPAWDVRQQLHQYFRIALTRLRRGDKSVLGFLSPRSGMRDAYEQTRDLLCFFSGVHPLDGYHKMYDLIIPEKRTLIMLAWEAFNPVWENIHLTETHNPYSVDIGQIYSAEFHTLERTLPNKPGIYSLGFTDILSRYQIPTDLPPVPEPVLLPSQNAPWWAPANQKGGPLIFQSGERVFVPGIYLSDPYAAIHYLHLNAPAPCLDLGSKRERDFDCTWSLIWPDTRYENGADIPEEEKLYFPEDGQTKYPLLLP